MLRAQTGDKLYTHFFDAQVGRCMPHERLRGLRYGGSLHYFATRVMAHCAANRSTSRAHASQPGDAADAAASSGLMGATNKAGGGGAAASGSTAAYWSRSRYCRVFRAWRKDRLRAEMLMHALHAMGIVTWRQ